MICRHRWFQFTQNNKKENLLNSSSVCCVRLQFMWNLHRLQIRLDLITHFYYVCCISKKKKKTSIVISTYIQPNTLTQHWLPNEPSTDDEMRERKLKCFLFIFQIVWICVIDYIICHQKHTVLCWYWMIAINDWNLSC